MTPPLSIQNCPPEIREHPLPFDQCSTPNPEWRPPEQRFARLSLAYDLAIPIAGGGDKTVRQGVLALYRPFSQLGIGLQADTTFGDQSYFLGRIQGSFNLQSFGRTRGTFAGLFGLSHIASQGRLVEDGSGRETVSGNLFAAGIETALDWRLFSWASLSPYMRILYSPSGNATQDNPPHGSVALSPTVDFHTGMRLSFDLFSVGY